jgi:hypothetical protein
MPDEPAPPQPEAEPKPKSEALRKVLITLLIIGAFAGAYFLGKQKHKHTLDAFARCLGSRGVKMYGAFWCPHCKDQKDVFGASFEYVPYIECGIKGSRAEAPVCLQAGIKKFPTWDFNGTKYEGVLPLTVLSEKTGCSLQ